MVSNQAAMHNLQQQEAQPLVTTAKERAVAQQVLASLQRRSSKAAARMELARSQSATKQPKTVPKIQKRTRKLTERKTKESRRKKSQDQKTCGSKEAKGTGRGKGQGAGKDKGKGTEGEEGQHLARSLDILALARFGQVWLKQMMQDEETQDERLNGLRHLSALILPAPAPCDPVFDWIQSRSSRSFREETSRAVDQLPSKLASRRPSELSDVD